VLRRCKIWTGNILLLGGSPRWSQRIGWISLYEEVGRKVDGDSSAGFGRSFHTWLVFLFLAPECGIKLIFGDEVH
jgi:hypothetical protein